MHCYFFSGDELLLTEMIFNGVFNDLTIQQCETLLSCFVFEEKVNYHIHHHYFISFIMYHAQIVT